MNPSAGPVMSHLLWKERWVFIMERLTARFSFTHYYNTKLFTESRAGGHTDFPLIFTDLSLQKMD